MKIYVLRHSIREPSDDFTEAEEGDPEAALTEDGEAIAESIGQWMADAEEIPSVIYASPTVRTQQTAEIIAKQFPAPPQVKSDASIGPYQSIRGLVQKLADDKSQKGVAIVSHRGSIVNGLKALNIDNGDDSKVDDPAMGELRVLKVKRGSKRWEEKQRVRPSDLGGADNY